MRAGRVVTGIGSAVLFLVGILHGLRLKEVEAMISAGGLGEPLGGILKGCWLAFSGEMVVLAVIAFLTSRFEGGAKFVLLCGLTMAYNAGILVYFLGFALPVYLTLFVMVMFLAGGFLQGRKAA